jgi:N4-gp56 family major capsid protein
VETALVAANRVKKWEKKFFREYLRDGRFTPYMGTDEFSMIQIKEDLMATAGQQLSITLINRLKGPGVTGKAVLKGNEEQMDQRTFVFTVDRVRNAVLHDGLEEDFSAIDLVEAKDAIIKDWFKERMRDELIAAMGSINGIAYLTASEAQKDTWLTDNADRVLFGASLSNGSSNDHSTSLGNIDNTADKFLGAALKLLKRRAKNANPKIRPIKVKGDEEWYVAFAGTNTFRDFSEDPVIQQANRDARERGEDNPLFTGGDLIYDGCIVREVPEIPDIIGVGNGGINVGPVYLCGAQALGVAWKRRTRLIKDVDDYGTKMGAGAEEVRDIKKLLFGAGPTDTSNAKQHGIATGYFASVSDT